MSRGEFGWLIWLAGLPVAPFVLPKTLDPWHAQMYWFHIGLGIVGAWQLARPQAGRPNLPLAWWMGWGSLLSLFWWTQTVLQQKGMPFPLLLGLGHFLTIGLFYTCFTSFWTVERLPILLRGLTVMGMGMVAYGVCQRLGLDKLFQDRNTQLTQDELH